MRSLRLCSLAEEGSQEVPQLLLQGSSSPSGGTAESEAPRYRSKSGGPSIPSRGTRFFQVPLLLLEEPPDLLLL